MLTWPLSISDAGNGGRDPPAKAREGGRTLDIPHLQDMGLSEQPAEDRLVPHILPRHRDQAHPRGLVIEHAYGHLIGDNGGDGVRIHLAGNGDHVQPYRTDRGHGLQLFQGKRAFANRLGEVDILAHRDKGAGEPSHRRGGKGPSLLDGIIEQGKRSG